MIPHEQWKNLEEHRDEDLSALINMRRIASLPSISPLSKIKRNLLVNSIWGLLIVVLYVIILVMFPLWQVRLSIGVVMLFTIWSMYSALQLYRKIDIGSTSNSCLAEMERHYKSISDWMKIQQNMGLLVYPISGAGGFMLGGFLGSGKPVEVFMGSPKMILIMLVTIAILVPVCFKLAKWMSKKSFGRYADQLKENIDALRSGL